MCICFFKQKAAYEMRISDWSSDVCSSDLDDAIVVVENVERNLEKGMSALEAARTSMDEVSAALVAIVLVLCAVFVPTLFLTGLSGAFYQQFAVTISTAPIFSLILSL